MNARLGCLRWGILGVLFLAVLAALSGLFVVLTSRPAADALAFEAADRPTTTPQPATAIAATVTDPASPTLYVSPTNTLTPLPTATKYTSSFGTPTVTRTLVPVPTRFVSPTPGGSAKIEGLVGHRQSLPLSCEASAAVDWAAFFGVQIDELEFFGRIPVSDDPEKGFVGDVNGLWGQIPPAPYGVHAAPVAIVLRSYGLPAIARTQMRWDEIQGEISAGQPVIVWVAGHVAKGTPVPYRAKDGSTTVVTRYEHTVMVIGYSDDQVWILDGATEYTRPLKVFLDSWGVLGNMGIVWGGN